MIHGVHYVSQDLFFLAKKHNCPNCKCELRKVKVSKVINSSSDEAKDMPKMFSRTRVGNQGIQLRSYHYVGNIKYVWKEFACDNCHSHYTVDDLKEIARVSESALRQLPAEEQKKIERKKIFFHKVLPIMCFILMAMIFAAVFVLAKQN